MYNKSMVNVIKEGEKTGHYISGRFVIHQKFTKNQFLKIITVK